MSSQRNRHKMSTLPLPNKTTADDVKLTDLFSKQISQLCMNSDYSDVAFIVDEQELPAHRVIMAARSEYFRALLYGGLLESRESEIHLKVPLDAFKALLRYIYSGHLNLSIMDDDNILDTLGLANQYGLIELEEAISDFLRQYLALDNVCSILDAARLYNLENLSKVCLEFMDQNASEILLHSSFQNLSKASLESVLSRDSFFAPEVQIFLSVWEWGKHNKNVDIKSVVSYIRLPLMNLEHLLQIVRPSGILDADNLLDAIEEQSVSKYLPYRAALWPDKNVASPKFQSCTIRGECRSELLNGDVTSYDLEKGYTCHNINDEGGIVVELGTICIINHIKMLLWDRDARSYSYYVEVSPNQVQWQRVIDYSKYHCRSWQFLYFDAKPVRYVKIVGTHNSVNKIFHVVSLEAMFSTNVPRVINGIVAPVSNVATTAMGAVVVSGVSRTRNALLNGNFVDYDWDSGYTCHQLGSGEIVIHLGQPYHLGSMRLLLWDCDDRTYSYYIETSVDEVKWPLVVDKRNEQARSWQNLEFEPHPVAFIKIVGTRNTANEIFHCVHLECPSQDPNYLKKSTRNTEGSKKTVNQLASRELATNASPVNHVEQFADENGQGQSCKRESPESVSKSEENSSDATSFSR